MGGAGYLGSVLCRNLLIRGHCIHVVDNLVYGSVGIHELGHDVRLTVEDIRGADRELFANVDVVIHLAGVSNDPSAYFDPEQTFSINLVGTKRTAILALEAGVTRYIYASTCSVYDGGAKGDGPYVEADEVSPAGPYPLSKLEAERALSSLASRSMNVVVCRMGTLYGLSPRMRFDLLVNTLVRDALHQGVMTITDNGFPWRPLLDVRDAARLYVALVDADLSENDSTIFNVASQNLRLEEIAIAVQEVLAERGRKISIRTLQPGAIPSRSYRVCTERLGTALPTYSPAFSLKDGIRPLADAILRGHFPTMDDDQYYNLRMLQTKLPVSLHE